MESSGVNLPSVLHPTTYNVRGYRIRVMSHFPLTEQQARTIALHTFRGRKWTKKDLSKVHIQYWTGDRESLALLERPPLRDW